MAWSSHALAMRLTLHVFWAAGPANRLAPASTGGRDSKCTLLVKVYQPAPCIVRLLDRRWNQAHKQPSLLPKSNGEVLKSFGDSGVGVLASLCPLISGQIQENAKVNRGLQYEQYGVSFI